MSELSKENPVNSDFLEANLEKLWLRITYNGFSRDARWVDKRINFQEFTKYIRENLSEMEISWGDIQGDINNQEDLIELIESITVSSSDHNIDGGAPDSIYLPIQNIDGGSIDG